MKFKNSVMVVILMVSSAQARNYILGKNITEEFKKAYPCNTDVLEVVVTEENLPTGGLSSWITQIYTGYTMSARVMTSEQESTTIECEGKLHNFTEHDDYYVVLQRCSSPDLELDKTDVSKPFFVDY